MFSFVNMFAVLISMVVTNFMFFAPCTVMVIQYKPTKYAFSKLIF